MDAIFTRLQIYNKSSLCAFLHKEKELMYSENLEGMKTEIRRRERELKQNRAKTMHPGELSVDVWYGGEEMEYRFNRASSIMTDIFESEGLYA